MADWPWVGSPYTDYVGRVPSYEEQGDPDCESFLNSIHSQHKHRNQTLEIPWSIMFGSDPYVYKHLWKVHKYTFHEYLANWLKTDQTFSKVNLSSGYNIGDKEAGYYASALRYNKTIKILDLSHTYIGNPGAKLLADALEFNTTLVELNLNQIWTRITDASIQKRISDYLERNKALQNGSVSREQDKHLLSCASCVTFRRITPPDNKTEEVKNDKSSDLKK